jgi:hypothetical protein
MPSGPRAKRETSPFFVRQLPRLAHFVKAALVQGARQVKERLQGRGCLNAS